MTNQTQNDVTLQDLLAEHADALLGNQLKRDVLLAKYQLAPDSYAARLMDTAEQLYEAMPQTEPSPAFVAQLYEELVGTPQDNFWGRWARRQIERLPALRMPVLQHLPAVDVPGIQEFRQLPPRMQIAAAGLGGFLLMMAARAVLDNNEAVEHDDASLADFNTTSRTA